MVLNNDIEELIILTKNAIKYNNNLSNFNDILLNNNISISNINNNQFDKLIYAIENETSIEFIKHIISLCKSLNYFITTDNNEYKSLLLLSINNLLIIELLLNNDLTFNIHGNDIVFYFCKYTLTNTTKINTYKRIFNYLLNHSYEPSKNLIELFLSYSFYQPLLNLFFD